MGTLTWDLGDQISRPKARSIFLFGSRHSNQCDLNLTVVVNYSSLLIAGVGYVFHELLDHLCTIFWRFAFVCVCVCVSSASFLCAILPLGSINDF